MAEILAEELDNARALAQDKKQAVSEGVQAQAADQVKKLVVKNTKRLVLRIVNVTFAVTVVGLIVTYIIMSVQFIAGNLYGAKAIALEQLELILYILLSVAMLVSFLLIVLILAIASDPVEFIWAGITN